MRADVVGGLVCHADVIPETGGIEPAGRQSPWTSNFTNPERGKCDTCSVSGRGGRAPGVAALGVVCIALVTSCSASGRSTSKRTDVAPGVGDQSSAQVHSLDAHAPVTVLVEPRPVGGLVAATALGGVVRVDDGCLSLYVHATVSAPDGHARDLSSEVPLILPTGTRVVGEEPLTLTGPGIRKVTVGRPLTGPAGGSRPIKVPAIGHCPAGDAAELTGN